MSVGTYAKTNITFRKTSIIISITSRNVTTTPVIVIKFIFLAGESGRNEKWCERSQTEIVKHDEVVFSVVIQPK